MLYIKIFHYKTNLIRRCYCEKKMLIEIINNHVHSEKVNSLIKEDMHTPFSPSYYKYIYSSDITKYYCIFR